MSKLREKTTATLVIAIFMISMMAFAVAIPVAFPPEYGIWQPEPDNGIVECSDAQAYSGTYSAYLQVNYPTNPASTYGSDSNEVYVRPFIEGNDVPQFLDGLDSFSFYYYRPSTLGDASNIPPQVDIWLSTTGVSGAEDEWLLGQIDLATSTDAWIVVPLSAITWIKAMGGTIYGTGSAGLEAAKIALSGSEIRGFGVQLGSPATRDESRTMEGKYYVDDIEINGVIYDFEFSETTILTTTVELPMVSISVSPTNINYGPLMRGETSATHVITVENIGEVSVDVTYSIVEDGSFYADYLKLEVSGSPFVMGTIATTASLAIDSFVTLSGDFAFSGDYTGTLVFWAEATA